MWLSNLIIEWPLGIVATYVCLEPRFLKTLDRIAGIHSSTVPLIWVYARLNLVFFKTSLPHFMTRMTYCLLVGNGGLHPYRF